ncbi:MAG: amidohydrolase family protein [Bacteroidetes bacterium]|jgi:cytosine/adenosine deaminase-related metal-dependent hydrolase|nr:amidohydrolase family protein [Bacteroidota bacterium]
MRKIAAEWVFDGRQLLHQQCVLVADGGQIRALEPAWLHADAEWHTGLLCPGFVNAHAHLELSHLAGSIPRGGGMVPFVEAVVHTRDAYTADAQLQAARQAMQAACESGTVALADISNTAITAQLKQSSPLYTHTFIELLGARPEAARPVFNRGFALLDAFAPGRASLSPHAPYSASAALLRILAAYADSFQQPVSIHFMESEAEQQWMEQGAGPFRPFLGQMGIGHKPAAMDSADHLLRYLPRQQPVLLVHCTQVDEEVMQRLEAAGLQLWYGLCPRSNAYIHSRQPHYRIFPWQQGRVALGTDSLASNDSLSILDEIRFLQQQEPWLPLAWILQAATEGGASFLKLAWAGGISPGKSPGILLIQGYQAENQTLASTAKLKMLIPPQPYVF